MTRARGYILIESLVGLLVLALVMGTVLETIAQSASRQRAALQTRRALGVARSELAGVGTIIPAIPGATNGVAGGVAWRVSIDPAGGSTPIGTLARVTVAAGPPGARPRVTLSELRVLQPGR